MARVALIGLGLIGGSLGLAIKGTNRSDLEIVGFDRDGGAVKQARKRGAIDTAARSAATAVDGAGLVIVAVPPAAVEGVLQEIGPALSRGAAVTDTASTKQAVMGWAAAHLPTGVSFVGGHPLAGKTDHGVDNADADLFRDRAYAVVPGVGASEAAVSSVVGLVRSIGAHELFLEAEEHDHYVAAVSHLPLLMSLGLFNMLHTSAAWKDFAKVSGPAYRDLTRLVAGDPEMSSDIAVTNRANLQHWLDRYIVELTRIRELLDGPEDEIFREFAESAIDYASYLDGDYLRDDRPQTEIPSARDALGGLLISPRAYERLRGLMRPAEERAAGAAPKRR